MPKKNKTLCVDDLRHAEYYGMQPVFDELYHRSLEGEKFYRPYGFNSEPGQHSSGISEHQANGGATQQEQTTKTSVTSGVYRPKQLQRK